MESMSVSCFSFSAKFTCCLCTKSHFAIAFYCVTSNQTRDTYTECLQAEVATTPRSQ